MRETRKAEALRLKGTEASNAKLTGKRQRSMAGSRGWKRSYCMLYPVYLESTVSVNERMNE